MISMTKLYDYLDTFFASVILLFIVSGVLYFMLSYGENKIANTFHQQTMNAIDTLTQANNTQLNLLREDFNKSYQANSDELIDRPDSLTGSTSVTRNVTQLSLVHYFAEVEICSEGYPSYKVKIDFYGINPRIEDGKLMVLSEHFTADYHEYFPIFDKNIGYDANLCGLKLLNK